MSRTHRKEPKGSASIRHPKTLSERRQLQCLINDLPNYDYKISKTNRMNRHIPHSFDDLKASSYQQNYHQ
jgi:hypothetical protein